MIIDHSEIRKGIRTVLLTVTNSDMPDDKDIAWENRTYKPIIGTPWIRETMLPGLERQSASDTIESVGVMQYDVFWPAGTGTESIEKLVDDIKVVFKPTTAIGNNSLVFRAERLSAIIDDKWHQIPVRLTWRAHAIG